MGPSPVPTRHGWRGLKERRRVRHLAAERTHIHDGLMARAQGAEVIGFSAEHPIEIVRQLTGGIGVDRAIDAVGVDAEWPWCGLAAKEARQQAEKFDEEVEEIAPEDRPEADQ
jgi:hypothetical protein